MKQLIVVTLGICLFAACVKEPAVQSTIVHGYNPATEEDILSLRIPIPMVSFSLSYRPGHRNLIATVSPLALASDEDAANCLAMAVTLDEPSIWLYSREMINLRLRDNGYEFYIPLSYAPYFSFLTHPVRLDLCGIVLTLDGEQMKQIGRFINAAVTLNNTLRR